MSARRFVDVATALAIGAMLGCGRSPLELGQADAVTGVGGAGPSASAAVQGAGASTGAGSDGAGGATTGGDPPQGGAATAQAAASTTGAGGAAGVGGAGPQPDPLACIVCITESCPGALACVQDPVCAQGLFCSFTECLAGGSPDLVCVAECFDGDLGAAFDAIQALSCVFGTCGDACGGLIPGTR